MAGLPIGVDTGMHFLGWTRQQAIDFMAANTCRCTTSQPKSIATSPGRAGHAYKWAN